MQTYIAVLRAINLGPARRVPMAELRALLTAAGYGEVRTHLASGNVLLASDAPSDELAAELARRIGATFGFEVPVVVRSRDMLAETIARDPLGAIAAADPRRYQVAFLSAEPSADLRVRIATATHAPERVAVIGREVYAWHPGGINDSPLAKLLASPRLGLTATARNWNTITTLLALATQPN